MKTRLNFLARLGLACAMLMIVIGSKAEPLAVSTMDAQLISYFRPYAPAAEVLVNKVEKNLPANAADKTDVSQKSTNNGNNGKSLNGTQICTETTGDKATEAEGMDSKLPKAPKLR